MADVVPLRALYRCGICAFSQSAAIETCPACGSRKIINAARETRARKPRSRTLAEIKSKRPEVLTRVSSRFPCIDELIGGGWVEGSVTLLAGDPGVGKSTLAMQLFSNALYVSAEESLTQIALRAARLDMHPDVRYFDENCVAAIIAECEACVANALIIDSIQTVYSEDAEDSGSMNEIRESARHLVSYAKQSNVVLIIIGHVTADGSIGGPEFIQHLVDCTMHFTCQSEENGSRVLQIYKNRNGPAPRSLALTMSDAGISLSPTS